MSHSDDTGLVCPPRLAPTQLVIVPIWRSDDDRARVLQVAERLHQELVDCAVRAHVDDREGMKPGAKYYEWEGHGVPVRLEVGPRDVDQNQAMMARRTGGKSPVSLEGIADTVAGVFGEIQRNLFEAAVERRQARSVRNVSRDQLIEMMEGAGGFAYGGFCCDEECEMAIKDKTKATVRVLPDPEFRADTAPSTCAWCGRPSVSEALWAKAY